MASQRLVVAYSVVAPLRNLRKCAGKPAVFAARRPMARMHIGVG